ncbi:MAG: hypothetical protein ACO32J_01355 [Phycisphaerales bacterium]
MGRESRLDIRALGAATAVALAMVSSADAALLSLSKVVTNTTASARDYSFEVSITVTDAIQDAGIYGGFAVAVTDFNRNGASVASTNDGMLYSGWVNADMVKAFVPQVPGTPAGGFNLLAGSFGQATFAQDFGSSALPQSLDRDVEVNDIIKLKFQFRLSAGDQAAISARFDVVQMDPVPAPAAAALLAGVTLLRRRRTNKS